MKIDLQEAVLDTDNIEAVEKQTRWLRLRRYEIAITYGGEYGGMYTLSYRTAHERDQAFSKLSKALAS